MWSGGDGLQKAAALFVDVHAAHPDIASADDQRTRLFVAASRVCVVIANSQSNLSHHPCSRPRTLCALSSQRQRLKTTSRHFRMLVCCRLDAHHR